MTVMVIEHAAQRSTAVAQEMEPIRDLDGLGCSLASPIGVGAGTITHDDLDAGMAPQPDRQGLSLSVGQQIDDAVTFQFAQDRAVALPFAPGPVIDAENTDFRHRIGSCLADATQQCRGTDRDCHRARHARSRIAAQRQGNGVVKGAKAVGMASPGSSDCRGTLGERPLSAGGVDTSEAADAHQQNKPTS
jgi:hypothetical protein